MTLISTHFLLRNGGGAYSAPVSPPPPPPPVPTRWYAHEQMTLWDRWRSKTPGTISQSGGAIASWTGLNGRVVSQGTASQKPTYNATGWNGAPSVESTVAGGPDNLSGTFATLGGTQLTFWVVGRIESSSAAFGRVLSAGSSDEANDYDNTKSVALQRLNSTSTIQLARNNQQLGQVDPGYSNQFILLVQIDGATAQLFLNGGAGTTPVPTAGEFSIENFNFLYNIGGAVVEYGFYQGVPSEAVRRKIEGDLAHEHGMTGLLPSGHPYEVDPPYTDAAAPVTVITAVCSAEPYFNAANPVPGSYGEPAGNRWPRLDLVVNGVRQNVPQLIEVDIFAAENDRALLSWPVTIPRDQIETIQVIYDNDWGEARWTGQPYADRNAWLFKLVVDTLGVPAELLPAQGSFDRASGGVISPAQAKAYENGVWAWRNAGSLLGNVPETAPGGGDETPPGSPSASWPPPGRNDMTDYGWIAPPSQAVANESTYFDIYLDTTLGVNGSGSYASPYNNWGSAYAALANGKKLGIKKGSTFSQITTISGKSNIEIRAYGAGNLPEFSYSYTRTPVYHGLNSLGRPIYKIAQGALPAASPYKVPGDMTTGKSGFPTRATILLVDNPSQAFSTTGMPPGWKYDHVGTLNKIDKNCQFYHDEAGGWVYFTHASAPATVEVPREDHFWVTGSSQNVKIVGVNIRSARDYGLMVTSGCNAIEFWDSLITYCGMSAGYIQNRNGAAATGFKLNNNRMRFLHGSGFECVWPGNVANWFTGLQVNWNCVQFTNMGAPYIPTDAAQDYYGAAVWKGYQGNWPAYKWVYECAYNYASDVGTFEGGSDSRVVDGDQGHMFWPDTVFSGAGTRIHHNWGRRLRSAGVFFELSPGAEALVDRNIFHDVSLGRKFYPPFTLTISDLGWVGGVCVGRGTVSNKIVIEFNTFVDCAHAALVIQAGTSISLGMSEAAGDVIFRYNIVDSRNASGLAIKERIYTGKWSHFIGNCFKPDSWNEFGLRTGNPWDWAITYGSLAAYHAARSYGGTMQDNIEVDPLLIDVANENYKLQPSSQCRGRAPGGMHIGAYQGAA